MSLKDFRLALIIFFLLSNDFLEGQNLTNTNETTPAIQYQVKPPGSTARHLALLFVGCLLTTFLIVAMIITYNRVTAQHGRQSTSNTNVSSRFRTFLQSIGWNNLANRTGFNFFSISNNNPSSTHHHHHHRPGETSRTHLNENQDEALLFDDPYADGGISGGIHGSSANPYKSLTLSVS